MLSLCQKYGECSGFRGTEAEAKETLSRVKLMTLERVKGGEREFFVAQVEEVPGQPGYYLVDEAKYSPRVGEFGIKGTKEPIPAAIVKIFPELGDEKYFIAEVGLDRWHRPAGEEGFRTDPSRKYVIEYAGDNELRRWVVPPVTDLATSQIIALLELRDQLEHDDDDDRGLVLKLDGVEFGQPDLFEWFEEEAVAEIIRRAEASGWPRPHAEGNQAVIWLLANFRKEDGRLVSWLGQVLAEIERQPGRGLPDSAAAVFAEKFPVIGSREEWEWLPAIALHRKKVESWKSPEGMIFYIPNGVDQYNRRDSREAIPARRIPGGGYFRVREREDGRTDLFLRRGSRELGDRGWLWVLVDPSQESVEERVVAALDPLENYGGLQQFFSPLFARVARAYALAKGKKIASGGLYSDAIQEALS